MIAENKSLSDLERFLSEAPAPMGFALRWVIDRHAVCSAAIKDALKVALEVERETDEETTDAILFVMAGKVEFLKTELEMLGYSQSEIWRVVEEMERFAKAEAKADAGNK